MCKSNEGMKCQVESAGVKAHTEIGRAWSRIIAAVYDRSFARKGKEGWFSDDSLRQSKANGSYHEDSRRDVTGMEESKQTAWWLRLQRMQ